MEIKVENNSLIITHFLEGRVKGRSKYLPGMFFMFNV